MSHENMPEPPPAPRPAPGPPRSRRRNHSRISAGSPAEAVFNRIIHQLLTTHEFTEIVYEGISPEKGLRICRSLAESSTAESRSSRSNYNSLTGTLWIRVGPTQLHDVQQQWVFYTSRKWSRDGRINDEECNLLDTGVGTRFEGFTDAYSNSSKEPDLFIRPFASSLPQIVIESGWAESWSRLHADKDLWLCGSTTVAMVMLLKWSKLVENRVKGVAEVWTRGTGDLVVETIPLFPEPPNAGTTTDRIVLTKGQVFGQLLPPDQNPNDRLPLEVWKLREYATQKMIAMGLTPTRNTVAVR